MPEWRLVVIKTALLLVFASLLLANPASAYKSEEETRSIGGYRFYLYHYEWNGKSGKVLQIWKGRKKVLDKRAEYQYIHSLDKQMDSFSIKPSEPVVVRDLTGDGIVDVIVEEWSGGAHCCYTYDIYALFPSRPKRIWHKYLGNGHLEVKFPKKGLPQLLVENESDYLSSKGDLNAMPLDVYQWRKGAFRLIRKSVPHKRPE